jgi:polyhydroxyalkanoate synthesis regulator phasin
MRMITSEEKVEAAEVFNLTAEQVEDYAESMVLDGQYAEEEGDEFPYAELADYIEAVMEAENAAESRRERMQLGHCA